MSDQSVAVVSSSVDEMHLLAQKAFALAVYEHLFIGFRAEDVIVQLGTWEHKCTYLGKNVDGERIEIHGTVYTGDPKFDNQGCVCIKYVCHGFVPQYPHSWHFFFFVRETYEKYLSEL